MQWEIAKATHTGGQHEQEDRIEIFSAPDGKAWLLIVADGMGGHGGGAIAAQAVIDTARSVWQQLRSAPSQPHKLLESVFDQAHHNIKRIGEKKGLSPRSTCVSLYVDSHRAFWAHLGDSRLYSFQNGQLVERTRDHSVAQLLVDMERIREEEMGTHPDQNSLLKSLGGSKTPEPDFGETEVRPDQAFLLCSDGLWVNCGPHEMTELVIASSLQEALGTLVQKVAERGGKKGDNISAALIRSKSG